MGFIQSSILEASGAFKRAILKIIAFGQKSAHVGEPDVNPEGLYIAPFFRHPVTADPAGSSRIADNRALRRRSGLISGVMSTPGIF